MPYKDNTRDKNVPFQNLDGTKVLDKNHLSGRLPKNELIKI